MFLLQHFFNDISSTNEQNSDFWTQKKVKEVKDNEKEKFSEELHREDVERRWWSG